MKLNVVVFFNWLLLHYLHSYLLPLGFYDIIVNHNADTATKTKQKNNIICMMTLLFLFKGSKKHTHSHLLRNFQQWPCINVHTYNKTCFLSSYCNFSHMPRPFWVGRVSGCDLRDHKCNFIPVNVHNDFQKILGCRIN